MPKPEALIRPLLDWFIKNARDLPWRRTIDPYSIWISEIMLQQTQVKTVIPYWNRWIQRFPTVEALAQANTDRVLKLWEGLGYYTRARNLHRAARIVATEHGGVFPSDFSKIIALPGIGRYTAGAICSIAFNQPTPVLDGNVIRVLTRLFAIAENPRNAQTNRRLWDLAETLVKSAVRFTDKDIIRLVRSCSTFNQALMELGATVCTPRQPACLLCPVRKHCQAHQMNRVDELPNLSSRAASTTRHFVAFVIAAEGHFLVRQRAPDVVNANLWEFPNVETNGNAVEIEGQAQACLGFSPGFLDAFCSLKHTITRYRINLEVFFGEIPETLPQSKEFRWCKLKAMDQLAFASAHRKIVEALKTKLIAKVLK